MYLEQNVVDMLGIFISTDNPDLNPSFRLNTLWFYKNLITRSPVQLIAQVMKVVGWKRLEESVDSSHSNGSRCTDRER